MHRARVAIQPDSLGERDELRRAVTLMQHAVLLRPCRRHGVAEAGRARIGIVAKTAHHLAAVSGHLGPLGRAKVS